ncbi:KCNT1 [Mytilus coruscus]|uniref:KCNT1 n=1 Tax=Mytilus coruscus TaxID=42192 RepID=A0A6J8E1J3_MYTCO|nr:KCNT1 [Mytilus coruscus]
MSNPWIYHHKYSNEHSQNMNNRKRRSPHRNSGVLKLSATSDNIPPPPKVRVEFFTNEKSLKEKLQLYFIKNQRSSLRIRIFNLLIKLLSCVLYLVRVGFDSVEICNDNESASANASSQCHRLIDPSEFRHNPVINWNHILFVNRDDVLWAVQVSVACISLAETILVQYLSYKVGSCFSWEETILVQYLSYKVHVSVWQRLLVQYLSYKGNILQQIISVEFILELINTVPFFVTMVSPELRNLFIPVFFNCWLAKSALQNMFNDLHRVMMKAHSALAQQLMILCATILCLVFTRRTKTTHIVTQALAPHWDNKVTDMCKEEKFAVMIDESNDKGDNKKLNILVRVYNTTLQKIATHFVGIPTCNIGNSDSIFRCLDKVFSEKGIPWSNCVGYSSDNCNVMIGKNNSVLTRVQEKSQNVFNVGCVCHLANICAQKAVKTLPLPVDELLIDVFFHFYHSSKRKEEYNSFLDFTDTEPMKLLKHCGTRWLSLERCVRRLLQQWPALKSYFQSHAESEKPGRIMRCAEFLANDEMWLYYAFLDFILPVLNDFNVMFQAGESMVGFLHTEMVRLLRKLMARFVSIKVITSQQDITKIDFQSTENQHDNERIAIGWTAREFLSDHEELSPVVVNRFFSSVRQFYCTTVSTMIAKFPFKDKVLQTIAYLNPDTRQNVSPEDVASLSDRFLSLSPDQKSQLEDQASDYILSPKSDLPPYDKENTTMNQFWQSMAQRKIPSGQPQFDLLFQLSKVMLTIPHSNADTERTFSMLKKIQTDSRDNLESKTIHSLLSIKINNYTDCYLYKPEPSLVKAAKSACTSYHVCGIQHLQRGGNQQFNLVDSIWFVVVTFSTVGYGDIYPDIWISQMYMIIMIGAALIVLPTQIENLGYTWLERQKQGGAYSSHRAQTEKHVVVVATTLQSDTIMDFLHEFYAHPALQSYFVVLLSPCELDPTMKMLLQVPIWSQRVIYIQGSAVKDTDLIRCRVQDALACFILAARNYVDKGAADQHTILRSWAIKDFAPDCPQYVQIFRPENKFHVKFAEHVVCEDEFKYALLANNCLCAATSTLVTLLIHTSRGQEGQTSSEEWQQLYGERSGNEIYSIKLEDSTKFFREYEGKSFTYASFHAHRRFGVSLVGVQQDLPDATIQLNPGPRHIMKKSDICFYMNITKEENTQTFHVTHSVEDITAKGDTVSLPDATKQVSKVASVVANVGPSMDMKKNQSTSQSSPADLARVPSRRLHLDLPKGLTSRNLQKRPSIAPVPAMLEANDIRLQLCSSDVESDEEDDIVFADEEKETDRFPDYIRGFPPVTPYIGTSPTLCHLMEEKREFCCLRLNKTCDHCNYSNANEYNWHNRTIILAADNASNGIYNFIVPLRSHARPKSAINPIVLLLEKDPASTFLETICHFPMVYWMKGSIEW